ncbi:MAG: hypothetical protein U1F57_10970 [bacterium]
MTMGDQETPQSPSKFQTPSDGPGCGKIIGMTFLTLCVLALAGFGLLVFMCSR